MNIQNVLVTRQKLSCRRRSNRLTYVGWTKARQRVLWASRTRHALKALMREFLAASTKKSESQTFAREINAGLLEV